jgi:Zn-dependent protease with chaperone function
MLTDIPGIVALEIAIALVPALVCWWQGRGLKRLLDDAALPERLLAAQRSNGATFGTAIVLLAFISADALWWGMPLMVLALIASSYPLRVVLFEETWSLPAYVWFAVRLIVGIWGFWILLVAMPMTAEYARRFDWLVATALATILVFWNAHYAAILRFLVRAEPIVDPALSARFAELVQRSGIDAPRFDRVALHGGVIANALALPSLRRSGVLFTETLLDRLPSEETVAICAHEIAHLEHFDPQLRRIDIVNLLLIASGAAVTPLARLAGLSSNLGPLMLWFVAVFAMLAWRARHQQRNETASDLRAVDLCRNAEALVSGLTRIYTMGRIPRRLDSVYEQRATHPSLARRIRDIRAAAGTSAISLETPVIVAADDGRSTITFDNDTLHWREGEAVVHSLSYAHLTELRVEVRGTRPASLIALERGGRRWEMPLAAGDVGRAQDVLDVVDARLPSPQAPQTVVWSRVQRLVLSVGALIGFSCGHIAMAFVTLLAVLQPSAPLVAAAGLASMTAAGLLLREGSWGPTLNAELAFVFALFGTVLLVAARAKRKEDVPRRAVLAAAVLGAIAALSAVALVLSGVDPVRLHQSARSTTAAPVLLVAFAGALTVWRSRLAKYAAIPVVVVAAATTAAASSAFLDRFGRDPFLAPADSFQWTTITTGALSEFSVPFYASSVRLSATGRYVAFVKTSDNGIYGPSTFHVGRPGQRLREIVSEELAFVGDEEILLADAAAADLELRLVRPGGSQEVLWRIQVPDVVRKTLHVTSADRRWRVMGWDHGHQNIVRIDGILGEPKFERKEWPAKDVVEGLDQLLAASGDAALVVENRYEMGVLPREWYWTWWLFPPEPQTWFRAATGGALVDLGTSRLDANCHSAALSTDALLCGAFDGTRTRFISIDPASKRIAGVAWLNGRFFSTCQSAGGWLCGWLNGSSVALNPARRQAIQIEGSRGERVVEIAVASDLLATLASNATGSTVKFYPVE